MREDRTPPSHGKVLSQLENNLLNALPLVRRIADFRLRGICREAAEDIAQKVVLNLWHWSLKRKDSGNKQSSIETEKGREKAPPLATRTESSITLQQSTEEMNQEDWLRIARVAARHEINSFFRSKYRRETIIVEASSLESPPLVERYVSRSKLQFPIFGYAPQLEGNSQTELASILAQVWKIILGMSLRQKYAFLFQKEEIIVNLLSHGCCRREEIAAALSCDKQEFDIILISLPLTDEVIRSLIEKKTKTMVTKRQVWMTRAKAKAKLAAEIKPLIR